MGTSSYILTGTPEVRGTVLLLEVGLHFGSKKTEFLDKWELSIFYRYFSNRSEALIKWSQQRNIYNFVIKNHAERCVHRVLRQIVGWIIMKQQSNISYKRVRTASAGYNLVVYFLLLSICAIFEKLTKTPRFSPFRASRRLLGQPAMVPGVPRAVHRAESGGGGQVHWKGERVPNRVDFGHFMKQKCRQSTLLSKCTKDW